MTVDPIRINGNDGKLTIWLNSELFYLIFSFETADYVFCQNKLLQFVLNVTFWYFRHFRRFRRIDLAGFSVVYPDL